MVNRFLTRGETPSRAWPSGSWGTPIRLAALLHLGLRVAVALGTLSLGPFRPAHLDLVGDLLAPDRDPLRAVCSDQLKVAPSALRALGRDEGPERRRRGKVAVSRPPEPSKARTGVWCAERGVARGHFTGLGANEVALLLPHLRQLQQLRHGLNGGAAGDCGSGRQADRGDLLEAPSPAPNPDTSFRPRALHCPQVHGATAGRPGSPNPSVAPGSPTTNPTRSRSSRPSSWIPRFPWRFVSIEQVEGFSNGFFRWNNTEHRQSGIAMLTTEQVHLREIRLMVARIHDVLATAYATYPGLFVAGPAHARVLSQEVWINAPLPGTVADVSTPAAAGLDGNEAH